MRESNGSIVVMTFAASKVLIWSCLSVCKQVGGVASVDWWLGSEWGLNPWRTIVWELQNLMGQPGCSVNGLKMTVFPYLLVKLYSQSLTWNPAEIKVIHFPHHPRSLGEWTRQKVVVHFSRPPYSPASIEWRERVFCCLGMERLLWDATLFMGKHWGWLAQHRPIETNNAFVIAQSSTQEKVTAPK